MAASTDTADYAEFNEARNYGYGYVYVSAVRACPC